MEEMEIITNEEEKELVVTEETPYVDNVVVETEEESGLDLGAVALGAGLALGAVALVKACKKGYQKLKAKKEAKKVKEAIDAEYAEKTNEESDSEEEESKSEE